MNCFSREHDVNASNSYGSKLNQVSVNFREHASSEGQLYQKRLPTGFPPLESQRNLKKLSGHETIKEMLIT